MTIKGKTFLITGGTGFIGSHTAKALVEKGAHVVIVSRTKSKENAVHGAKLYRLNLSSPRIENIFKKEKPDYVYHFASNLLAVKEFDPTADAQTVLDSVNLLKNASKFGVKKFIFSSTGAVYGNNAPQPTSETQSANPENPYVLSKYVVENYLNFYKQSTGMPYVVLRYSNVYGPKQKTGALAYYARALGSNEQAEIPGDGSQTRDYVFIDDVVRANVMALKVPNDFKDPIFNVSTGKETSLNKAYEMIAKILKKEAHPIFIPSKISEQSRYCLNSSKLNKAVGWKAQTNLEKGLKQTLV